MNILLINKQINPASSGVASHFFNIGRQLSIDGHKVIRLVAKNKVFKKDKSGVEYYHFKHIESKPGASLMDKRERIKSNRKYLADVLKKVNIESIDLAIVANDYYVPILKQCMEAKKIIVIIPSSLGFSEEANMGGHKKIILRMKKNLLGVKTVVLSKKMKSMLNKILGKKYDITVIPPGVESERFFKRKKTIKTDVLYVGRMAKEKNIEDLLSALSLIKNSIKIKFVGSGNQLENIKIMAKKLLKGKRVVFLGKKKDVERYYTESKVFVLPSKYEAFGLVILEAMAASLPVIAFRPNRVFITASDEIISNGSDGFLVKNIREMAQKVELLLKDEKLRSRMSANALKKAAKFNWDEHVNNLMKLVEN